MYTKVYTGLQKQNRNTILVLVFHRILDFKTGLDFYPALFLFRNSTNVLLSGLRKTDAVTTVKNEAVLPLYAVGYQPIFAAEVD